MWSGQFFAWDITNHNSCPTERLNPSVSLIASASRDITASEIGLSIIQWPAFRELRELFPWMAAGPPRGAVEASNA